MASQHQRARILLHRAADRTHREIAAQLGLEASAVEAVLDEVATAADAADVSAEQVVAREIVRGYVEPVVHEMTDDFVQSVHEAVAAYR